MYIISGNNTSSMMNDLVSVGIDVSKKKLDVACLFTNHTAALHVFENTTDGIRALIQFLKTQRVAQTTPCVIESTGDYHLLASIMLTQAGFTVNCINPLITKRYQRASIRNAKTDSIDAKRLAEIGILESALPIFSAQTKDIFLKRVISYLAKLENIKQQLTASYRHLCDVESILGMTAPLEETDRVLEALTQQMTTLEHFISENVARAETLAETKGVSKRKAAQLVGMLGAASFASRDALVAYTGLDVMPRTSGTWRGKHKLSKRGDPFIRKLLYRMAWGLKTHNETYRQYYEKLRATGKHYTTCLMAVARKFLRFVYALLFKPSPCPQVPS